MVAKWGSPRCWFQTSFSKLRDLGGSKRDVQLFSLEPFFVMTAYAPDCKKDLDVYETFTWNVTNIFWKGRREGANDFYITGDFNVELGLLSTIWERKRREGRRSWITSLCQEGHRRKLIHTDVKTWDS